MKKWCVWLTPLFEKPGGRKLLDLPPYAIVDATDTQDGYAIVEWRDNSNRPHVGWANCDLLEDYVREFPSGVVLTQNPTPNPNDFEQYLVRFGNNLCGHFCVAFVAGWKFEIEGWLDTLKPYPWYARLFPGGMGRTTGIADLDKLLSTFEGYQTPSPTVDKALTRSAPKIAKYVPGRVAEILTENYIIAGCKIDRGNGRLRGSGVPHWVVLDRCVPDRFGGWIELYNPAPDSMERYSWQEFIASAGQPFGIVVQRGGRDA